MFYNYKSLVGLATYQVCDSLPMTFHFHLKSWAYTVQQLEALGDANGPDDAILYESRSMVSILC
ncbi:uncharacterized protein Bfra_004554 [Botrytis fragariae]|uniref:Uncharacterized protein n=1 Tax=Botrytis fragariae TaxID=1964551 RepID=A0A8H6AVY4_9HELO|nr:uncharacterized protein Bfra_004554 [Botrytis fragariae]KAF5874543.1 hypothetical protein Bfra_004554 [Botrytis fragariae]